MRWSSLKANLVTICCSPHAAAARRSICSTPLNLATSLNALADKFGTRGLPVTLSTACASGATAIQLGVEAIRRGESDRVLSIGTDGSVSAEALIRFSLLSALSTQNEPAHKAAKPFSKDRDGFVMAEGSGAMVLESLESASGTRREHSRHHARLRREGGRLPPHPVEAGRLARHRRGACRAG